ncbi:MAG: phosphotransferase [Nocardioides sp.]
MLSRHHQIALVDQASRRVLVVPHEEGPRLPRPDGRWPDHRDLVAAVAAPGAVLAGPPWREDDGTVTNVLLGDHSGRSDATWWPLDDVATLAVSDETRAGLLRTLGECEEGAPDDGRAAWFRRGWLDAVHAWVDDVFPLLGIEPRGPAEHVKIWSLSAVLRHPVVRAGIEQDVWFKATCDGFHSEPALTQAICGLAPDLTPRVLAVDGERAWMLMEPIPTAHEDTDPAHAPAIAQALARLQLDTLDQHDALRSAGAPDRGRDGTLAWLHTVLRGSVERHLMTDEQHAAALAIEPWLVDRVEQFWSHGLPDTLAHGDLHLGNVAWVGDRPVFFDWTDACLTHPFLDACHLADSAADGAGPDQADEAAAAVWSAYLAPWRAAFPDVDLEPVRAQVEVAELVFQMISYEQIYRAQPETARWELATIVVEILDKLVSAHRVATEG